VIRPSADRVLIKPLAEDKRTEGGILLPDVVGDRKQALLGEVLAVGPGRYEKGIHTPVDLREGEKVLYLQYHSGVRVDVDGVKCELLRETDILAKVN